MDDRICIACKNFYLDGGSPGYSSWTPGSPMSCFCTKGVWNLSEFSSAEDLFNANMKARECADYEPSELAIEKGWKPL